MRALCLLIAALLPTIAADADDDDDVWPNNVTPLDVSVGHRVQLLGSLRTGAPIADLRLPPTCVRDVDKDLVSGNHVLYAAELPPKGDMTITVIPRGESSLTLYAYLLPIDRHDLPNDAAQAQTCKSSARPGVRNERLLKVTGGAEPQNVVIGVTTGGESGTGKFLLSVDVR